MKEGWICVFTAIELLEVKLAEDVLKQNGIPSHIVNKPDSAIPSLGDAELYVHPSQAEEAVKVLVKEKVKV